MKKLLSLILVITVCLSLCACGKSQAVKECEKLIECIGEVSLESKTAIEAAQNAFNALADDEKTEVENYFVLVESQETLKHIEELEEQRLIEEQEKAKFTQAKEAYDNIKAAWLSTDLIADDLYGIWHGSIYETKDMVSKGVQFFIDETSLSREEVVEGLASRYYVNIYFAKTGISWNELSEDDKQVFRSTATNEIEKASRAGQYMDMSDALFSIINAYKLNGRVYDIQESLETAKQAMMELPEDYEHYLELKGFYVTANALLDFCMDPSGSFDQYKLLLNDYRKEARDYMNDLDLIFE